MGKRVREFQPWGNIDSKSYDPSISKSPDLYVTSPKTGSPKPPGSSPFWGTPHKSYKQNEVPTKAFSKAALKKQRKEELLKTQKTLTNTLLTVKKPGGRIANTAIAIKGRLPTQIPPCLRPKKQRGRGKAAMVLRTEPKVRTGLAMQTQCEELAITHF